MFTISFFLLLSQLSWPHCYCTLFSEYTLPPWEALGPPLLLLTQYAQGFSLGTLLYTMYMLSIGQIKSLLAFFPPNEHLSTLSITHWLCSRDPYPCLCLHLDGSLQWGRVLDFHQSPGQNSATRLLTPTSSENISPPTLINLHWLSFKSRITCEILLLFSTCLTCCTHTQSLLCGSLYGPHWRLPLEISVIRPQTVLTVMSSNGFRSPALEPWDQCSHYHCLGCK